MMLAMRILIVEDVPAMRQFLALMLHEFKAASVDHAGDGLRALQMFMQEPYDLVLLDLNLPLMDGLKVLGAIRQKEDASKPAHVIIITTEAGPDAVEKALKLGVHRILSKPLKASTLHHAIREEMALGAPVLPQGAERREVARMRVPATVMVEGEWQPIQARIWDLGPTGAFIITDQLRPPGTHATLRLELPHLQLPLSVRCRCVHVREQGSLENPQGFGVEFEHKDAESEREFMKAFVSP
jgi:two-component system chemotaxis response regulator CheY